MRQMPPPLQLIIRAAVECCSTNYLFTIYPTPLFPSTVCHHLINIRKLLPALFSLVSTCRFLFIFLVKLLESEVSAFCTISSPPTISSAHHNPPSVPATPLELFWQSHQRLLVDHSCLPFSIFILLHLFAVPNSVDNSLLKILFFSASLECSLLPLWIVLHDFHMIPLLLNP